ncbi:MAG TPA: hypothetical protein VK615_04300 [Candidatus Binatia bacterium]|nr:hypothetical protein [Candidatus Binatia bacterium]
MSLINDALKKASQTPAPTTPAEIKEPLHVAMHTPPPRWPMFVIPPLVAVVFAAGTLLVVRGWQGSQRVSARETVTRGTEGQNDTKQVLIKDQHSNANAVAAVTSSTAGATTNVVATSAPTFPNLKVQGIVWQPSRPSVVINNKSLFIGEKIEKAKVIAIDQETVTVLWNGEQRVLTVP